MLVEAYGAASGRVAVIVLVLGLVLVLENRFAQRLYDLPLIRALKIR